jgi:hypothetical protein
MKPLWAAESEFLARARGLGSASVFSRQDDGLQIDVWTSQEVHIRRCEMRRRVLVGLLGAVAVMWVLGGGLLWAQDPPPAGEIGALVLAPEEWQELLGGAEDNWQIQRRSSGSKPWKTQVKGTKSGDVRVRRDVVALGDVVAGNQVLTGSPSNVRCLDTDICSDDDLVADDDVYAGGSIRTGSPTSGDCGNFDICSGDDLVADEDVLAGGSIRTGSPTSADCGNFDICSGDDLVADEDVIADDDVLAGDWVIALGTVHGSKVVTGSPSDGNCQAQDVCSTDDVVADDDVYAGGTVLGVVQTASFGRRLATAMESAEARLVDEGQGRLDGGVAKVGLDPVFAEMIAGETLLVQVTLTSEANGVWVEKSGAGFTVRELMGGSSDATFDWRVSAVRKGYEKWRLEASPVDKDPEGVDTSLSEE